MKSICIILRCFTLSLCFLHASAQEVEREVVATAGNADENALVSLEWTIGETLIDGWETEEVQLTQGFHQPDLLIIGIPEQNRSKAGLVRVYPNPGKNYLYFDTDQESGLFSVRLFDMTGRLLYHETYSLMQTSGKLDLRELAEGTYLLRIELDQGRESSLHKIIKK